MPEYTVYHPRTGRTLVIRGERPPTEDDLRRIFAATGPTATPPPEAATREMLAPSTMEDDPPDPVAEALRFVQGNAITDLMAGARAGLASTVYQGGDVIRRGRGMERIIDAPEVQAAMTPPDTTAGTIGQFIPLGPPVAKGAQLAKAAIPTRAKAGAKFQQVMAKTRTEPVDISGPGNVALKIQTLAEAGGSMPKVARDFIRRVTDPNKSDLTYEEARLFYSNLSRLSADEFKRLTPAMKREVGTMRVALNKALEGATARTNTLPLYKSAMREYARASRISEISEQAAKWGAGAVGLGTAYRFLSD